MSTEGATTCGFYCIVTVACYALGDTCTEERDNLALKCLVPIKRLSTCGAPNHTDLTAAGHKRSTCLVETRGPEEESEEVEKAVKVEKVVKKVIKSGEEIFAVAEI